MAMPVAPDHTLLLHVVEQCHEAVPISIDIIEHHGFVMIAYGGRGRHGEDFVECAYASWQCYKHVGLRHHQRLAVGEVLAWHMHINISTCAPVLLFLSWHFFNCHGTIVMCSLSHTLHEPQVASSIH